ncbi:MAG: DUF2239 family protein [Xanthomonadales bacterium]|nr:DUF2239 family protein [Xanthomonadales bacterium]
MINDNTTVTAFAGHQRIAAGRLRDAIAAVKARMEGGLEQSVLIFSDISGEQLDFDFRGSLQQTLDRLHQHPAWEPEAPRRKPGPGRPKLGVVAREVTLLPSQWEWLRRQPGGASPALRRLVELARRSPVERAAKAWYALGKVTWSVAGDLAGFEEVSRAIYAQDAQQVRRLVQDWPDDLKAYVDERVSHCQEILD